MRTRTIGLSYSLGWLVGGCFVDVAADPPSSPPQSDETGGSSSSSTTVELMEATQTTTGSSLDSSSGGWATTGTTSGTTSMSGSTSLAGSDSTSIDPTDSGVDPCEAQCAGLVCGNEMACDCGECSAMATCSIDQTYCAFPIGFSNVFPDMVSVPGQLQLGFRFEVFQERTVRRLGMIAWGAGSEVRLALYQDDNSGPSHRVVQTGAVTLFADGPNEFDVGATTIAPGNYWVMLHTAGSTPLRRTINGDNQHEEALRVSVPFSEGFPLEMNDEMVLNDYRYNLYMVVED